ncbi:DNA topoisomerase [Phakopsora pachyrhizi]|uniref:DNA topoisomerase n=1 Tax=Phakopsora pachyrhizi TaxID=170000 RepID=A0AAV0AMN4_PHAPC|nr:DNA topoisomerase [Phakopsora pachyrhizi]CAH7669233.1 DNA topoisomerase [Phakopsora pachyrhizi]
MRVLCVAEKPSIARSVTQILSGNQFTTRISPNKFVKNFDFEYRFPTSQQMVQITVTAVLGHLTQIDFHPNYKGWKTCDPFALFDAPVIQSINPDHRGIERNLLAEAKKADQLMIWTDCDREGEHIGSEVASVCRRARSTILVSRARFSAIIPAQIHKACREAGQLDMNQAYAVETRIELDLRIGAALTRYQTLGLQERFYQLEKNVVSYGPCQFPTLGFVVDQYEKVKAFVPEPFWYIHVVFERDDSSVEFKWKRQRLFDWHPAFVLYELCADDPEATIKDVQLKPAVKWKPLPLTTVELQKSGSRLLRLTPKQILDIAEKLYQKGFVSYPRTETDQFDPKFDFMTLIEKQVNDTAWGAFAKKLQSDEGWFQIPRNGKKNDKAHPPIHPTAHANNLTPEERRVYEFITRRYLACCSKNATGKTTTVEIDIAGEEFTATGLVVLERNYLEVYIYDKWNGNTLPDFQVNEKFMPSVCELNEGSTTRPNLLTEADLVGLMDKNGIGTDATIAEHIAKIIERNYVFKTKEGSTQYLVPSTLGIGLVEGYNAIGLDKSLSKPQLRREVLYHFNLSHYICIYISPSLSLLLLLIFVF